MSEEGEVVREELVSVVIPTMGRRSLEKAVQSALSQTHPRIQVVVVNDSDTDVEVAPDPRVRLLSTPHPRSGGSAARQIGIAAAEGGLIALLDDDDFWEPSFLEEVLSEAGGSKEKTWWIGSAIGRLEDGSVFPSRAYSPQESVLEYIFTLRGGSFTKGAVPTSSMVFPKALGEFHPWRESVKYHQDLDWLADVCRERPDIKLFQSSSKLVNYGDTPGSVVKKISPSMSLAWAHRLLELPQGRRLFAHFLLSRQPFRAAASSGKMKDVLTVVIEAERHGHPNVTVRLWALTYFLRSVFRRPRA